RLPFARLDRLQQRAEIQLLDKRPNRTRRVVQWQQTIEVDPPAVRSCRSRCSLRPLLRSLLRQFPKQAPRFRHRPLARRKGERREEGRRKPAREDASSKAECEVSDALSRF